MVFTIEKTTMINDSRTFIDELQCELIGGVTKRSVIIKRNSEDLATNGEICFSSNLLAWRGLIPPNTDVDNCTNILEHYLRRKNYNTDGLSEEDILKKAEEFLVSASEKWSKPITKCTLKNGKVCLFLNRRKIIKKAIKEALELGVNYGKRESVLKSINMKISEDKDSEITTERLRLIREVTERMLQIQGFKIYDDNADVRYLLTTKSEGPVEDGYQRYVCGVVKNQNSNTKETSLTWALYIEKKIEDLASLVETKFPELNEKCNLGKIAQAVVTFELLAVKPSRPVFVQCSTDSDKAVSSSKGGSFVLYNAARMTAILERFKEEECLGNYPNLLDINNVDFEQLTQEEEWELVYNYISGYPEIIETCVWSDEALDTNPQTLCLFLSRLSQKFSVYYRRVRILTEGRDHLVPTMMARLYLLRALQIVVNNSLAILNIVPVRHM